MTSIRCITGLALVLAAGGAWAQAAKFPVKPIRMIVGFTAGGATDIVARALAPGMLEAFGQTMVVEHRPGASSQIAGELVAKSPPDGHTIMMTTQTLMTSVMIEGKSFPDIVRDFSHVALAATSTLLLVVHPSMPVKSVKDLVTLVRARPGQINYASGGVGTTPHLSGELLSTIAKLKMVHVPYKGEAPGLVDVMGGHVPLMFCNVSACISYIKSGKLRAIAGTGSRPPAVLPQLPTVAASGVPGFEVVGFFGVLAPPKTPAEIVGRLNAEIVKILARPDIQQLFSAQALEPGTLTAPQFADYVPRRLARWTRTAPCASTRA